MTYAENRVLSGRSQSREFLEVSTNVAAEDARRRVDGAQVMCSATALSLLGSPEEIGRAVEAHRNLIRDSERGRALLLRGRGMLDTTHGPVLATTTLQADSRRPTVTWVWTPAERIADAPNGDPIEIIIVDEPRPYVLRVGEQHPGLIGLR
ncbi:hypothetical protein [Falsiroseomonas tokyonensis]|uniref:PAS domain-containing protein n=1 Tax=Falsiroseomonas tokyonensis TaxID=430521 RepID=A0ABV7C7B8_9PROT|nr:hypothetical protein [Falsiroseomonas tokyonensis]MBU8542018.1 hypothetical protein [Falsiroseomonas tokyonensis]